MNNYQEFSRIGKEIRDAVNDALDTMDFSGLNDAISRSVDRAVKEVHSRAEDAVKGTSGQMGDAIRGMQDRVNEAMEQAVRFTDRYAGRSGRKGKREKEAEAGERIRERKRQEVRGASETELLYGRAPGVSGVLYTVFGSILLAGFGIPFLISLALGAGFASFGIFQRLGLFFFLPMSAASAAMLGCGVRILNRRKRFHTYIRSIGTKTICAVRTLSRAVGKSESFVCRDIQKMIERGLFLQGHIDEEQTCLMVTDETYRMYLASKERTREAQEERKRELDRQAEQKAEDPGMKEILDEGMACIETIRKVNDELPDPVISEKLDKLERVIGLIYVRLQKNPEKLDSMKRFTDYYLPTTIKLVRAYREFEQSEMDTERIRDSKAQIEQTLDTINLAFGRMLDSLYEEDTLDISTDIQVLKTLLAQEGLTGSDFGEMDDIFEGVSGVRKAAQDRPM